MEVLFCDLLWQGFAVSTCCNELTIDGFAVGADADDDKIELLLSEIKGKDITELIASGREKLASVPSGGGGVAVAAAASGGGGAAAPAAEAKKEEKVEEKEESDDVSLVLFTDFIISKNIEEMYLRMMI